MILDQTWPIPSFIDVKSYSNSYIFIVTFCVKFGAMHDGLMVPMSADGKPKRIFYSVTRQGATASVADIR